VYIEVEYKRLEEATGLRDIVADGVLSGPIFTIITT